MCFLPRRTRAAARSAMARLEQFIADGGAAAASAGATCRSITDRSRQAALARSMPVVRQAVVARGPAVRDQDAFERKLLSIRKQTQNPLAELAERSSTAGADRFLHRRPFRPARSSTRGCCCRRRSALLRGPARSADRVGAGAGPPAFLDQHLPALAAGAPLPVHRPQWRDQHRARQRQLDERAPPDDGIAVARRRSRQDVADHPARPVGHGLPRQCARAADRRRLFPGACDDDADPRGVGRQCRDGCRSAAPSTNIMPR